MQDVVSPAPAPREPELWRRCGDGDTRARDNLVDLYMPLARRLAKRYAGVLEPYDDLLQVACLGLLNAIDRFDPDVGTPFAGFARPTILGELKRHLRDKVWTLRIPRPLHDLLGRVERALEELGAAGRPPSVAEIAAHLEVEPHEVLEALEADRHRRLVSLDAPPPDADDAPARIETLGGVDAAFERADDRCLTAALLPVLDDRARELLRLRFAEGLSQRQIAARLGRSQMYVSRRLRHSLASLREAADAPPAGTH